MAGHESPVNQRIQDLGLLLSVEAMQALEGLPRDHAFELLDAVKGKVDGGHIKNPSNYICASIARGYVTQADGGAMTASIVRAGGLTPDGGVPPPKVPPPPPGMPRKRGFDSGPAIGDEPVPFNDGLSVNDAANAAASNLAACRGMLKAQQVGLALSDEAVKALLTLPTHHASELLETVSDKHQVLRDPSNYIVATVARGFVPRAAQFVMGGGPEGAPPPTIGGIRPAPPGPPPPPPMGGQVSLVPHDLTPIESRVLQLNAEDLWGGQNINVETLMALRCVDQDQALQLLSSLEAKGRGKGIGIQNPNNYVQAAVVKIKKGLAAEQGFSGPHGHGGGSGYRHDAPSMSMQGSWNSGNQTRQKALDMGLDLHDESLDMLMQISTKDATWLLEAASWVNAQDEDPNEYIQSEASKMISAMVEASMMKKPRWM